MSFPLENPDVANDGTIVGEVHRSSEKRFIVMAEVNEDPIRITTPLDFCSSPSISSHGRYIAFSSTDSLLEGDWNSGSDIYVYDREWDVLRLVPPMQQGNFSSPSVSDIGQVVYGGYVHTEMPSEGGLSWVHHLFLYDLESNDGSILTSGANDHSRSAFFREKGTIVLFTSQAGNLIEMEEGPSGNGLSAPIPEYTHWHLYQKDLTTGEVRLLALHVMEEN